jgi:hypothetical protein
MIRDVAFGTLDGSAEEPFPVEPFRRDWFIRFSIEHNLYKARIRAENPDLYIVANLMRTQHPERVRMDASNKRAHLVPREAANVESFHTILILIASIADHRNRTQLRAAATSNKKISARSAF